MMPVVERNMYFVQGEVSELLAINFVNCWT